MKLGVKNRESIATNQGIRDGIKKKNQRTGNQ
jgi:hypothetical protein